MSRLGELQHSYLNSIKSMKKTTNRGKSCDKKDDDVPHKNDIPTGIKSLARPQFPLTPGMLILSACFWLFMTIMIYECIIYGTMYTRITMEEDLKRECLDKFSSDEENLKLVDNYSPGDAGPYLIRLRPTVQPDYPMETTSLPPLVTAVSSSDFYQLQGLIEHYMEEFKSSHSDLKLIVYDLGLSSKERQLTEKYCYCEVRNFPFEEFPSHVANIWNYAWRPIILQIVLEEFGSAVYLETTTRLKSANSANFLKRRGLKNYFLWDHSIYTSLVAYTSKEMFEFFGENRCTFLDSSLLSSEAIVLYRSEATWRELMKPWLKCALNADCIAPQHATYSGCFDIRHPRTTGCHRFDMSALSIILNRGSQYTLNSGKMVSFRIFYKDISETLYFPEQPWTYTQIGLLLFSSIIAVILYKYVIKRRRCRL